MSRRKSVFSYAHQKIKHLNNILKQMIMITYWIAVSSCHISCSANRCPSASALKSCKSQSLAREVHSHGSTCCNNPQAFRYRLFCCFPQEPRLDDSSQQGLQAGMRARQAASAWSRTGWHCGSGQRHRKERRVFRVPHFHRPTSHYTEGRHALQTVRAPTAVQANQPVKRDWNSYQFHQF